ncbi:MAG: N-6 DNA methylase, partial [Candidatus Heimdallarchaeota archaeon]|nr:N-6 DNA methylase [Candidatus Heimdallarchaeota archaeon]
MVLNSTESKIQNLIRSLIEADLSENEAKSMLLKLFIFKEQNKLTNLEINDDFITIKEILRQGNSFIADILHEIEIYPVSNIDISKEIILEVKKLDEYRTSHEFFSSIQTSSKQKRIGQYFTSKDTIKHINDFIISSTFKLDDIYSIIDFTAGLGDFVSPLIMDKKFRFYAVELDPLSYEYCIFNLLFKPNLSQLQACSIILTVKQGDAIAGLNGDVILEINANNKARKLLLEYIELRFKLFNGDKKDLEHNIRKTFSIRKELGRVDLKFANFNWFIDFPERFLDSNLNIIEENNFDFVVGNPPWISYDSFAKREYKKILSLPQFTEYLYGKFNFSLPFLILAFKFSKKKGALVLPQGIVSETYGHKIRKRLIIDRDLTKIVICKSKLFKNVTNDYCIVQWDKENSSNYFEIQDDRREKNTQVLFESIFNSQFKIPLISRDYASIIEKIYSKSFLLKEVAFIRRGLTLAKKYQEAYKEVETSNYETEKKKLIRHNSLKTHNLQGVFNFQVFYCGEKFVYDKKLLGAAGEKTLFEREKIIRRNRGNTWYIGLDLSKEIYVNDIFDMMYSTNKKISLEALFGYLSSSLIQYLTEYFIQRDITSNTVRELPFPKFTIA